MKNISRETLETVFAAAVQAKVPVALWSDPGCGKTATIKSMAEQMNIPFAVIDLTTVAEPSDLTGLPVIKDGGVRYEARSWANEIAKIDGPVILLVDEIGSCDPMVAAAAMPLIHERMMGDLYLGDNIIIIMAGNPPESAANGYDLPAPLANRMLHLEFTPLKTSTWALGLMNGFDTVTPDFDAEFTPSVEDVQMANAKVAGFAEHMPTAIQDCPDDPTSQSQPWPSQRSWTNFATILGFIPADDTTAIAAACAGLVGETGSANFVTWLEYGDLHTPRELLNDPSLLDWNARADRVYAMLLAVATYVLAEKSEADFKKAWKLLAGAKKAGKLDVAGSAAFILQRGLGQNKKWKPQAEAKLFTDVFTAAGLVAKNEDKKAA